jgi:copper(I)-binding protein
MGALLLSPIALTACSAGQVSQTATQDRDKVGPEAEVGELTLRQVTLEYPDEGRYESGDDVPLVMAVVNSGNEADTLVGIEGEGFDGVIVSGQATASPAVPGSPSATPSAPGAAPTTTPGAPTTSAGPTTAAASSEVDIPLPAGSTVFVGGDDGLTVELADLAEELTAGQSLELTLTFERAGEVTVAALVANPEDELPREEAFDFHEEEEAGEGESEG